MLCFLFSFFLAIAVLQFFPKFSTISPGLVILPLLIVLGITAIKDGYEDVKRHQSDRKVNNTLVRTLRGGDWVNPNAMQRKSKTFVRGALRKYAKGGKKLKRENEGGEELAGVTGPDIPDDAEYDDHVEQQQGATRMLSRRPSRAAHEQDTNRPRWENTAWEDVAVGDFVKIMDNQALPADILICATSEEENVAFVETKNLDGETNLKSRNAVPALTHLRSAADCSSPHNAFRLDCDRPETNMYKLNAAVRVGNDTFPVDMPMVLLRGTIVRNTGWVIGVVLFTGEDTRIVMNSGGTPSKRSKVERQMNPQVFINLIILALMAVACGIVDSVLQHRDYPKGAPWLFGDNRSDDNPSINGLITFAFALITYAVILLLRDV
jgi:phospholipid-translocating ATPase